MLSEINYGAGAGASIALVPMLCIGRKSVGGEARVVLLGCHERDLRRLAGSLLRPGIIVCVRFMSPPSSRVAGCRILTPGRPGHRYSAFVV